MAALTGGGALPDGKAEEKVGSTAVPSVGNFSRSEVVFSSGMIVKSPSGSEPCPLYASRYLRSPLPNCSLLVTARITVATVRVAAMTALTAKKRHDLNVKRNSLHSKLTAHPTMKLICQVCTDNAKRVQ